MNQTELLAALVIVPLSTGVLYVFFFQYVPRVSRLIALYGLHTLRDDLYKLGATHPEVRETLLFRDVEFMHALAIHVVRDRNPRSAVGFFFQLSDAMRQERDLVPDWRLRRYDHDRATVYAARGLNDREVLADYVSMIPRLVALRVVGASPVSAVGAFVVFPRASVRFLAELLRRGRRPEDHVAAMDGALAFSRAVSRVACEPTPELPRSHMIRHLLSSRKPVIAGGPHMPA